MTRLPKPKRGYEWREIKEGTIFRYGDYSKKYGRILIIGQPAMGLVGYRQYRKRTKRKVK